MEISGSEFSLMQDKIHSLCGVLIGADKRYLIQQRLGPVAEDAGCRSFGDLHRKLHNGSSLQLATEVINAITTNETFFFRDGHPFHTLKTSILPNLLERLRERKKRAGAAGSKIRIWSVASSTGQEAYSLAMLIDECLFEYGRLGLTVDDFYILSTDISNAVLNQAREGLYDRLEMSRGLSVDRKRRYFAKNGEKWQIKETLRNMVDFRKMNLTKPFPMLGRFDLLLCRNVLIYFDEKTRTEIYRQFHRLMDAHAYLLLGATENIYQTTELFESLRMGSTLLYMKKRQLKEDQLWQRS